MFHVTRFTFKYGHEWDAMDCTFKVYPTFEKALKYAVRYAIGIKFAGVTIENDDGKTIYEITSDGNVFDHRAK